MKRTHAIIATAVLFIAVLSCTESENTLQMEVAPSTGITPADTASLADTVSTTTTTAIAPGKHIYFTIDDAPLNGSHYIDSIVRSTEVKTNIFMVGSGIDGSHRFRRYFDELKVNPYIEIYNHSYSHAHNKYSQYYTHPETVLQDFEKNQADFHIQYKIARLPGRNLWCTNKREKNMKQSGSTSAKLLAESGYQVFGWDIEWNYDPKSYAPKQSIDQLVSEIENMVHASKTFTTNHIVLLMHNQMFGKVNEQNDMEALINKLKALDYMFEYLTAYPS